MLSKVIVGIGQLESLRYELKSFGIKVVLIEPGATKTNFLNSTVFAESALEPKSPYRTLIQKWKQVFLPKFENGSSSTDVANVILQAVTSTNPRIRYSVGDETASLLDARRKMSDVDFEVFVQQNYLEDKKILVQK